MKLPILFFLLIIILILIICSIIINSVQNFGNNSLSLGGNSLRRLNGNRKLTSNRALLRNKVLKLGGDSEYFKAELKHIIDQYLVMNDENALKTNISEFFDKERAKSLSTIGWLAQYTVEKSYVFDDVLDIFIDFLLKEINAYSGNTVPNVDNIINNIPPDLLNNYYTWLSKTNSEDNAIVDKLLKLPTNFNKKQQLKIIIENDFIHFEEFYNMLADELYNYSDKLLLVENISKWVTAKKSDWFKYLGISSNNGELIKKIAGVMIDEELVDMLANSETVIRFNPDNKYEYSIEGILRKLNNKRQILTKYIICLFKDDNDPDMKYLNRYIDDNEQFKKVLKLEIISDMVIDIKNSRLQAIGEINNSIGHFDTDFDSIDDNQNISATNHSSVFANNTGISDLSTFDPDLGDREILTIKESPRYSHNKDDFFAKDTMGDDGWSVGSAQYEKDTMSDGWSVGSAQYEKNDVGIGKSTNVHSSIYEQPVLDNNLIQAAWNRDYHDDSSNDINNINGSNGSNTFMTPYGRAVVENRANNINGDNDDNDDSRSIGHDYFDGNYYGNSKKQSSRRGGTATIQQIKSAIRERKLKDDADVKDIYAQVDIFANTDNL